jgi:hypothetical protein
MMNPFERHGITHLSPSSLNLYAEQGAMWTLKYLHGYRDDAGAAAWRGKAVEAGLDLWLYKRDLVTAKDAAMDCFEANAQGEADDKTDKERNAIIPMLEIACHLLRDTGPPEARQLKVTHWFDGIEIPVVGYADYIFTSDGVELKTKWQMPSSIPDDHGRQAGLYSFVKKKPWRLLYVTPKKGEFKDLENPELYVKRLSWIAHNIRRALSVSQDKFEVAKLFSPNLDHPYLWKREEARLAAAKIWP